MTDRCVYRASAEYADEGGFPYTVTRHFLTKRARDRWAERRREGYPEEQGGFLDDGRPAIPPATRVDVADSDPVIFPEAHRG